jgi:hypothetical protein
MILISPIIMIGSGGLLLVSVSNLFAVPISSVLWMGLEEVDN